jgi:hypothetical protein
MIYINPHEAIRAAAEAASPGLEERSDIDFIEKVWVSSQGLLIRIKVLITVNGVLSIGTADYWEAD